jgi:hypothetical protein
MAEKKRKIGKLLDLLKRFKLEKIYISSQSGVEISYTNWDAEAAWILYVELVTRTATQPLKDGTGIEKTALDSIHSLFPTVREVLKLYGRNARDFTRIAILVLNKLIRPFTSKWHLLSVNNAFEKEDKRNEFRLELEELRLDLLQYASLLADMAKVEDFSIIE